MIIVMLPCVYNHVLVLTYCAHWDCSVCFTQDKQKHARKKQKTKKDASNEIKLLGRSNSPKCNREHACFQRL